MGEVILLADRRPRKPAPSRAYLPYELAYRAGLAAWAANCRAAAELAAAIFGPQREREESGRLSDSEPPEIA